MLKVFQKSVNVFCFKFLWLGFFFTVAHVYMYFFSFVERCPVFNVVAKKLDTTSCSQTRCPPYSYRSNNVDVGMYT